MQKTTAGAKTLWVIGDRGQIYTATAPAGPWALASMGLPVQEDPPFYHLTDIGMYDFPSSYPSAAIDAQNWALGEDGAIYSDYPVPPPERPDRMDPGDATVHPHDARAQLHRQPHRRQRPD